MSIGRTTRDAIAIASIVLVCAAVSVSPAFDRIQGLSIDILTALRWQVFGKRQDPAASPAVVVAIDEETYRAAPFKGSPTLTWTSEIGRVLGAILDGGAKVVGFDIVATFGYRAPDFAGSRFEFNGDHPFSIGGYAVLGVRGAHVSGGTLVAGLLAGLGVLVLAAVVVGGSS